MYTGGSNCDGYTTWTSSNSETYGNTSSNSMCMSVPVFGGLSYTGSNRYTGGCLSSSDLSTANTYIANLYTFYSSANTLYTNQRTTINASAGAQGEGVTLLQKFSTYLADYTAINNDFSTFYAYINAFQNTSTDLKSCSIFRTDMLIFSNTICFKTIQGFVDQTLFLCLMGPFLSLMSICMFAAIRCPLQKDEDTNKTAPVGMGQQMQNIDKQGNPYNNYYTPQNQQNTGYVQVDHTKHGLDI